MTNSYTPSFTAVAKINMPFTTNNPTMLDNTSDPVTIIELKFNEITRSIEAVCSDRRMRQCRIDRLADDKMVKALTKTLQVALNTKATVRFIAAGGASANTWFYNFV